MDWNYGGMKKNALLYSEWIFRATIFNGRIVLVCVRWACTQQRGSAGPSLGSYTRTSGPLTIWTAMIHVDAQHAKQFLEGRPV